MEMQRHHEVIIEMVVNQDLIVILKKVIIQTNS